VASVTEIVTGKKIAEGDCMAGVTELVFGKNRAGGVAGMTEIATGKNRAVGDSVVGVTEMATGGGEGKIEERKGWSVRRWKRQARGTVAQEGHSQLQRLKKKKRKGVLEVTDKVGQVETKKPRRDVD
jgi:hypothetical protein